MCIAYILRELALALALARLLLVSHIIIYIYIVAQTSSNIVL